MWHVLEAEPDRVEKDIQMSKGPQFDPYTQRLIAGTTLLMGAIVAYLFNEFEYFPSTHSDSAVWASNITILVIIVIALAFFASAILQRRKKE